MNTAAVIKLEGLLAVALFCAWVYTLVDVAQTPQDEIRNLNKGAWIVIVLFFSLAGIVGWFVLGRPEHRPRAASAHQRGQPSFPEYDRTGRAAAVDPEKDEEFLRQVRARAEQQRKRYEEQKTHEQEGK